MGSFLAPAGTFGGDVGASSHPFEKSSEIVLVASFMLAPLELTLIGYSARGTCVPNAVAVAIEATSDRLRDTLFCRVDERIGRAAEAVQVRNILSDKLTTGANALPTQKSVATNV
jgi:hypothetical protein